jgi:hypothetical protein
MSRAELLKTIGVAVLVLGLIAASLIYWNGEKGAQTCSPGGQTSELDRSWKDGSLPPEDLKGSSRTLEMNFGKVAVLISTWLHRLAALKPHQLLAIAVATIAVLAALACFLVAKRLLREQI